MAYVIRSCDLLKDGISQKGNFDGLHKHVMGCFPGGEISQKGNLMAYVSRSCDLSPKQKWILEDYVSRSHD
jgi:hypothetical protein